MTFRARKTDLCFSERSKEVAACLQANNGGFTAKISLCASLDSQGMLYEVHLICPCIHEVIIHCVVWIDNSIAWCSILGTAEIPISRNLYFAELGC